jgi:hypothetical protein
MVEIYQQSPLFSEYEIPLHDVFQSVRIVRRQTATDVFVIWLKTDHCHAGGRGEEAVIVLTSMKH